MTLARTDSVAATPTAVIPGRATKATINADTDSFSTLLGALTFSRSAATPTASASPRTEPARPVKARDASDDQPAPDSHSPLHARPTQLSEHASERAQERVAEVRSQQTARDAERADDKAGGKVDEATSTAIKPDSQRKPDDLSDPVAAAPAPAMAAPAPAPTDDATAQAAAQAVASTQPAAQTTVADPQVSQEQVAASTLQPASQTLPAAQTTPPNGSAIPVVTPGTATQTQTDSQSHEESGQHTHQQSFAAIVATAETPAGSARGTSPVANATVQPASAPSAQSVPPPAARITAPASATVTVLQASPPVTDAPALAAVAKPTDNPAGVNVIGAHASTPVGDTTAPAAVAQLTDNSASVNVTGAHASTPVGDTPARAAVAKLTDNPASVVAAQSANTEASAAGATPKPDQPSSASTHAVPDPIQPNQTHASAAPAPATTSATPASGATLTGTVASQPAPTQPAEAVVAKADSPRADVKPVDASAQPTTVPVTTASAETRGAAPADGPAHEPVTAARMISQIEKAIQSAPSSRPAEIKLQLHPEHLGRVDVLLATGQDGLAVTVTAHNPHTRALIDAMLPQLKESLQQQGVDVRQLTLSTSSQSSQPDMPDRGWQREAHGAHSTAHSDGWHHDDERGTPATTPTRRSRSASLIDYTA